MFAGRCLPQAFKPEYICPIEISYLLQFFKLREHTSLLHNLPPRGLARGCDESCVATTAGKSIFIILSPKSKYYAVTLNWKRMEAQRDISLKYSYTLNHTVGL